MYRSLKALYFNVPQRTLTDIRDGETYRVRKLADGNVWMTENLRLEFDGDTTYDSTTTNLTDETTIKPNVSQNRNGITTDAEKAAYMGEGMTVQEKVDRWLSRSAKKVVNNEVVWATETNPMQSSAPKNNLTGEDQKFGVYYNWYTATASTGTYATSDGGIVQADICPRNWHLPGSYSEKGSYAYLIRKAYPLIQINGTQVDSQGVVVQGGNEFALGILHGFPFSQPFSGRVSDSSNGNVHLQGVYGLWWIAVGARTTTGGVMAWEHYIGTNGNLSQLVQPVGQDPRQFLLTIRCLAK